MLIFKNVNANEKLTLLLDWFANPSHAPIFVAQQNGFFKEQHLDVEIIGPADPSDPPKLVAAGKADIAITYEPQFMEQVDQGLPLIRIGTLIDKPLNCLVVLKTSSIKTLADLKGKRVGYSGSGINNITLKTMLKTAGLNISDIELINVHYNLTQALFSHKVDAATGFMRTFELIQLSLAGYPALAFYPEQYGIPTYSELILITRKNLITDPRLPRFLRALKKGTDYLHQHPEESWQQFSKNHPELNNELNHQAWKATLPYFNQNPIAFNAKEWLQFARFLQQNGLIKNVKPINDYAIKE
jgi:putative hydroxymethylpyrimidine transport system substrate-binding protein